MAIDARIAMGVQAPEIESPMNALAKVMQVKQAQQENMLGQMKLDEAQRAQAGENRLAQLLAGGKSGDEVATGLAAGGYGNQALAYTKQQAELGKTRAATEKDQLKATMDKLALGAQILSTARDQQSYDAARQTAMQAGLDVSRIPAQFDPAFVQQKLQEGQTIKEQLEQKWKAMQYTTPDANARLSAQTAANSQQIAREANAIKREQGATSLKPLPAPALKMQQQSLEAISTASNTQADLSAIQSQIDTGKLKFGPVSNLTNRGLNALGMSTEESRNFSSFKSSLEKLRNDSLRLNTGVQTDGDAQRAWNELFENISDTDVVKQRLAEIKKLNERAVVQHKLNIDGIRANYGQSGLDTSAYETQGSALGAGGSGAKPAAVKDKAAFDALPSGTLFIAPDGTTRRKP